MTDTFKYPWMGEIQSVDQLPERFQGLGEKIGLQATLKVMEHFEGEEVYFYKLKEAFTGFWHDLIRKEWKKHNLVHLAHKYGVTVTRVREIVKDHEDQKELFQE